jgi:hypothetical protein
MALAFYGDQRSEALISDLLQAEWYGVPAGRVVRLVNWGYRVQYEQSSLQQAQASLEKGVPVILFIRTGGLPAWEMDLPHAVVLAGLSGREAFWHDPDRQEGPDAVDLDSLMIAWAEMDYYAAFIQK